MTQKKLSKKMTLKKIPQRSKAEEDFAFSISLIKLIPDPVREYRFHAKRRFRFDFAWPEHKLAVEVDGGTWAGGRHTRGKGYENDCIKFALAIIDGWQIFRFTSGQVKDNTALTFVELWFKSQNKV